MSKINRNDPCPCGSGKKYKKCCINSATANIVSSGSARLKQAQVKVMAKLQEHALEYYGTSGIMLAWDSFFLGDPPPLESETVLEFDTSFMTWCLFDYCPEDDEVTDSDGSEVISVLEHFDESSDYEFNDYEESFIEAIYEEPFSFFKVSSIRPGKTMVLDDILLKRSFTVSEKNTPVELNEGDVVFTKVVTVEDSSIMVGCSPCKLPPMSLMTILGFAEQLRLSNPNYNKQDLLDNGAILRRIYFDLKQIQ
jgi:hypothetical protein